MLSARSVQSKKVFILLAALFLLFTGMYGYTVLTKHFACKTHDTSNGKCLPKGTCTAEDGAVVPCSFLNPDGSYKQKEAG